MAVQPRPKMETPAAPALEDLLHPDAAWWLQKFGQFMVAVLDSAARRPEPVVILDAATLKPLIWACQRGRNGDYDNSPLWRDLWGTEGGCIQEYVRGLFQVCRDLKYPPPERYEQLVAALAERIITLHQAAVEQQQARAAKLAERQGPVARAQAAAAVLEHVEPLQSALLAFDAATRDAGGTQWNAVAMGLQSLEHAAKRELS